MKVLIIGSGGREHALAWKVAQSSRVSQIFVAPGNAGTASSRTRSNVDIAADDVAGLLAFARREKIDLTIVGPEAPLVLGLCDEFSAAGLRCFGPGRLAARLEGSKAFTKDFLRRHGIPTAAYAKFTRHDFDAAWVRAQRAPLVVKADGLAAGKGVVICATTDEAVQAAAGHVQRPLRQGRRTGRRRGIPRGRGSELHRDGRRHATCCRSPPRRTTSACATRDEGPNTGGMGAYSPAPVVTPEMHERIMREVMVPTVAALAREGTPYLGFLYAGVMIHPDGTPNVLEFNCRFGDPETQPILMRMRSDLVALCEAALDGRLAGVEVEWDPRAAVGVVMAAGGYPDDVRKGDEIHGLDAAAKMPGKVFHAGTTLGADGRVVTSGGRVLCAVGLGASVRAAQKQAYELAGTICWEGLQYRKDIGYRAIAREG